MNVLTILKDFTFRCKSVKHSTEGSINIKSVTMSSFGTYSLNTIDARPWPQPQSITENEDFKNLRECAYMHAGVSHDASGHNDVDRLSFDPCFSGRAFP